MTKTWRQLGAAIGGVLLVLGSLMTWISVDLGFQAFSSAGRETTEGKLTLAAGVVLVALGLLHMRRLVTGRMFALLAAGTALFGSVVLFLEYLDVLDRIAEADGTPATAAVGWGVWVAAAGALIALTAAAWTVVDEWRSS